MSEKTKHTPGPWELCADTPLVIESSFWEAEEHKWVATICKHNVPVDERAANARLIAAAPEMLEALEKLMESLQDELTGRPKNIPKSFWSDQWCKAEAAIRKAKGEL